MSEFKEANDTPKKSAYTWDLTNWWGFRIEWNLDWKVENINWSVTIQWDVTWEITDVKWSVTITWDAQGPISDVNWAVSVGWKLHERVSDIKWWVHAYINEWWIDNVNGDVRIQYISRSPIFGVNWKIEVGTNKSTIESDGNPIYVQKNDWTLTTKAWSIKVKWESLHVKRESSWWSSMSTVKNSFGWRTFNNISWNRVQWNMLVWNNITISGNGRTVIDGVDVTEWRSNNKRWSNTVVVNYFNDSCVIDFSEWTITNKGSKVTPIHTDGNAKYTIWSMVIEEKNGTYRSVFWAQAFSCTEDKIVVQWLVV